MTLRAAAEQALNALDYAADRVFSEGDDDPIGEARAALRAALAAEQPQASIAYPDADLSSGLSWDGHIVCGDRKSIDRVKYLIHRDGCATDLQRRLGDAERRLAEHPQPEAVAWPKVNGTARMFDNARALMVIMEREPTDDEMRAFDDAIKGWGTSPPAAPQPEAQPVIPPGFRIMPDWKGYALLGTGRYAINHSAPPADPELGAELFITFATEAEKSGGRQIGERRDNPPDAPPTQPEDMVIRIGFLSERAVFALEDQLQLLREAHGWAAPPPAVPEPSEAEVEAAWRAIPASHEDSRVSVITKGDVWAMLRAAAVAAARGKS